MGANEVMVVRLGDASLNTDSASVGTALPVYLDYYDPATGVRTLTRAVPSTGSAGGAPCTLSYGSTAPGSTSWWLESEGLASISLDRSAVAFPCHTVPAGADVTDLLGSAKTIAVLRANGAVDTSVVFTGYTGYRGTATGVKQVATLDGSQFWVAGVGASQSGIGYLSGGGASLHFQGPASTDGYYLPGTYDLRGVGLAGRRLFLSSAAVTEPNQGGAWDSNTTAWGGVSVWSTVTGRPTDSGEASAYMLPGFDGSANLYGFAFVSPTEVLVLQDTAEYTQVGVSGGFKEFARSSVGTVVTRWTWDQSVRAFVNQTASAVFIPEAVLSLTYQPEDSGAVVAYATSRSKLYRVVPADASATVVAQAAPGQVFRSAAVSPGSCTETAGRRRL